MVELGESTARIGCHSLRLFVAPYYQPNRLLGKEEIKNEQIHTGPGAFDGRCGPWYYFRLFFDIRPDITPI